jgi:hypothetical protein
MSFVGLCIIIEVLAGAIRPKDLARNTLILSNFLALEIYSQDRNCWNYSYSVLRTVLRADLRTDLRTGS